MIKNACLITCRFEKTCSDSGEIKSSYMFWKSCLERNICLSFEDESWINMGGAGENDLAKSMTCTNSGRISGSPPVPITVIWWRGTRLSDTRLLHMTLNTELLKKTLKPTASIELDTAYIPVCTRPAFHLNDKVVLHSQLNWSIIVSFTSFFDR